MWALTPSGSTSGCSVDTEDRYRGPQVGSACQVLRTKQKVTGTGRTWMDPDPERSRSRRGSRASLPEQQVLLRRSGSLVLEDAAEHFGVPGQGLDDCRLPQVPVPQLRLPQQAVEQLRLCGAHLHRASPHPQRAAVIHLWVQNKRVGTAFGDMA